MSSSPPTFNPPQSAPSGSKLWLWLILAFVAFCLIACTVGWFLIVRPFLNTASSMGGCAATGDIARKATLAYAIEHDGKLPSAETWQDDIRPYYERLYEKSNENLENIPVFDFKLSRPGEPLECEWKDQVNTGFIFNAAYSEAVVDDIENPTQAILIFESLQYGYNVSGDPSTRPEDHPVLDMFDRNEWLDFYVSGQIDFFESDDDDFDMDVSIEDALSDPEPESIEAVEPDDAEGADEPE